MEKTLKKRIPSRVNNSALVGIGYWGKVHFKYLNRNKKNIIKKIYYSKNYKNILKLKKNNIPVMGHIGFTPQFKKKFKVEGDTKKKAKKLLKEAMLIEKAGAFSIVLECLNSNTSKIITNKLKIPTIGIGSSSNCDGQILVTDDMLGLSGFYPKFVKKFTFLDRIIEKAVKKYTKEVKQVKFPSKKNFLNGSRIR